MKALLEKDLLNLNFQTPNINNKISSNVGFSLNLFVP